MLNALTQSPVFGLVLICVLAAVYALPVIIGPIRNVECLGLVVIFNVVPVGWLGVLIVACMMPRKKPVTACPPSYYEPHW